MSALQYAGYVALCCIVALESMVLRSLLQEVLWLKSLSCTPEEDLSFEPTAAASELPTFQANVLDSLEIVTDGDIRGQDFLIVFLNAARTLTMRPDIIDGSLHALWEKTDRCMYICCEGNDQECRSLRDRHQLHEHFADGVKILVDDSGQLTALFGVIRMPSAIMFDEDGRVVKTGLLETKATNLDQLQPAST